MFGGKFFYDEEKMNEGITSRQLWTPNPIENFEVSKAHILCGSVMYLGRFTILLPLPFGEFMHKDNDVVTNRDDVRALCASGPGDQGILFEYRSKEFGDHADPQDILAAARKIKTM